MTTDTTAETTTPANDGGTPSAEAQTPDTTNAPADSQATEPKADATEGDKKPEDAKPKAPEAYEFKAPEGIELDKAATDEFSALAKELDLDQATAQKVFDIGAKMAQRQAEQHAELVAGWMEQVKTDKDIGGDKLEASLATARKALDAFGTPDLKAVLDSTGLGNHPEVIKAFYRAGKAISEDTMAPRANQAGAQVKDPAKVLYGN